MTMQELTVPVLAAGGVVALIGTRAPKAARGRLRQLGWCAALLVIATIAMSTAYAPLARRGLPWWALSIPLAAVALLVVRPRLAPRVVPLALILLGVLGLAVATAAFSGSYNSYGLTEFGNDSLTTELILPQAYLFLLLGGWLIWRSPDPVLRLVRRVVIGPGDVPLRAALPRLTLLGLALVLAGLCVAGPEGVLAAAVLFGAAAMLVIRRWPELAGRIATLGTLALGAGGLVIASRGSSPAIDGGVPVAASSRLLYGAVAVESHSVYFAVVLQSLCLLAFGAWLVPQAFPRVRRALGMDADAELTTRIVEVTQSRSIAIDSAASDLRRLERDLHDGAQARLVALGMSLRAAERLIPVSPDAAIALVAEARETSVRALAELRELVRGVLPPVLADRGLADAVRALALDSPLQVTTDIDLPGRAPAPIETACYFAVAEILTNAAKHSSAREARIGMSHAGGLLHIEVTDFGLGGADPARGTGLAGVEKRLASFDGILAVSSPPGGPTIVILEVPCVLSSVKTSSC